MSAGDVDWAAATNRAMVRARCSAAAVGAASRWLAAAIERSSTLTASTGTSPAEIARAAWDAVQPDSVSARIVTSTLIVASS